MDCARNGWTIIAELREDGIGASRWSGKDRPEYRRLQNLLVDADVLVTWEASRAHRDLEAYVELRRLCEEHGVLLRYSGRTFDLSQGDDRFATGLDALLAEKEAEQIRVRVLRGLESRAAAGEPHGKIPYGYRAAIDDAGNRVRVPRPEEAEVLRDAARMVRDGRSLRAIVKQLNAERRTNRGRDWTSVELRRKLLSPTYAGIRVHHGKQVPATWQPILSDEEHSAVTAILTDPDRLTQRGSEPVHLLTGIASCGKCGAPMGRRKNKSGSSSYACTGKFCVARSMGVVDEFVEAVVVKRLSRPDIAQALQSGDDSQRREAFAEIRSIRANLAAYEQQAIDGHLEPEEFLRLRNGLREKLADAEARANQSLGGSLLPAQIAGPDAAELWANLPMESKRGIVRAMCHVLIDPAQRSNVPNVDLIRIEWKTPSA
ncbi:Resolvase [Rhodococcus ruber]|uniref:Resolvase n=2 Tax=Nocardiaceae TaxID=85025 RepID=A0A098BUG2_9NOCA|nr:Resolvase [Rhodococcus ruber]